MPAGAVAGRCVSRAAQALRGELRGHGAAVGQAHSVVAGHSGRLTDRLATNDLRAYESSSGTASHIRRARGHP